MERRCLGLLLYTVPAGERTSRRGYEFLPAGLFSQARHGHGPGPVCDRKGFPPHCGDITLDERRREVSPGESRKRGRRGVRVLFDEPRGTMDAHSGIQRQDQGGHVRERWEDLSPFKQERTPGHDPDCPACQATDCLRTDDSPGVRCRHRVPAPDRGSPVRRRSYRRPVAGARVRPEGDVQGDASDGTDGIRLRARLHESKRDSLRHGDLPREFRLLQVRPFDKRRRPDAARQQLERRFQ